MKINIGFIPGRMMEAEIPNEGCLFSEIENYLSTEQKKVLNEWNLPVEEMSDQECWHHRLQNSDDNILKIQGKKYKYTEILKKKVMPGDKIIIAAKIKFDQYKADDTENDLPVISDSNIDPDWHTDQRHIKIVFLPVDLKAGHPYLDEKSPIHPNIINQALVYVQDDNDRRISMSFIEKSSDFGLLAVYSVRDDGGETASVDIQEEDLLKIHEQFGYGGPYEFIFEHEDPDY